MRCLVVFVCLYVIFKRYEELIWDFLMLVIDFFLVFRNELRISLLFVIYWLYYKIFYYNSKNFWFVKIIFFIFYV